ncbi:MAG: hypothetical protein GY761_06340, partial [Hyphomicrobiales bacterium]|nr:hypothetical protein [Hyphomicrobiales bacterium]
MIDRYELLMVMRGSGAKMPRIPKWLCQANKGLVKDMQLIPTHRLKDSTKEMSGEQLGNRAGDQIRPNSRQACALLAIILALGACADRGTLTVLDTTEDQAGKPETLHQIYVVTNRKRKVGVLDFSGDRSTKTSYARYVMSIPPTNKSGKVEWTSGKPDQKTDIVAIEAMGIDDKAKKK